MKEFFNDIIYEPWPWWVGGPLIGLFVIVLVIVERKQLGISSSFQYVCAQISPFKLEYFKDTTKSKWQFWFVLGLILGGFIVFNIVPAYQIEISANTVRDLEGFGVGEQDGYVPVELYSFSSIANIFVLLIGGLFIGFGARYANGCTAGHAIMGCALLSPASIISTACFFVGGLIATYLIIPLIF